MPDRSLDIDAVRTFVSVAELEFRRAHTARNKASADRFMCADGDTLKPP